MRNRNIAPKGYYSAAAKAERAARKAAATDLRFEDHGSIWLLRPLTAAGREFLKDTPPDDAQFLGDAMAVEPRYVTQVADAVFHAGLTVTGMP